MVNFSKTKFHFRSHAYRVTHASLQCLGFVDILARWTRRLQNQCKNRSLFQYKNTKAKSFNKTIFTALCKAFWSPPALKLNSTAYLLPQITTSALKIPSKVNNFDSWSLEALLSWSNVKLASVNTMRWLLRCCYCISLRVGCLAASAWTLVMFY